jgi:SAM-dependent methyltransferase
VNFATLRKKLKLKLLSKLLSGNNVHCNVCGSSFSTFIPYLGRINAQCPNCGSLERVRLIYQFIKDKELVNPATRLLHIAPELSLYKVFKPMLRSNYVPADKFEPGYAYPRSTQNVDITSLKFEDEHFDLVICIHVLEHVHDDEKAISEIYRVLKKGGAAILQVPYDAERITTYEDRSINTPEERRKHFLQFDHVRIYGRDFIDRFLKPGFSIGHRDYRKEIDAQLAKKLVVKDEEIFLLRK